MAVRVFAIDGPDGVGKTTLINRLTSYLNQNTSCIAYSISPSNTVYGKAIKGILKDFAVTVECEELLQITTLEQCAHQVNGIIDSAGTNVDDKTVVIFLDRWVCSTGVYQSYVQRGDRPFIYIDSYRYSAPNLYQLDKFLTATLILDADDEILNERLYGRDNLDKYEAKDFQRKVREGYREIFKYNGNRNTYSVKVNGTEEENFKNLLSEVVTRL